MPLENCTSCRRVFNRTHRDICPSCWETEQGLVDRIADFLTYHPKAGPEEILAQAGVSQPEIMRLLRRGRLVGYDQLGSFMVCERCGAQAVDRGTFCAACRAVVLELAGPPKEEGEEEPEAPPSSRSTKPLGKPAQTRPGPGTAGLLNPDIGPPRQDIWQNRAR